MQEIDLDSKDILTLALIGSVLPGMWLAYRLDLLKVFNAINDKNKILLPSFLFLFCPFLIPFISSHPLPGSLSSIIPVTTFILGQILAESNNKKMLSEREKEVLLKIDVKLSDNKEKARINKGYLEDYIKGRKYANSLKDLSTLEDITSELNQLLTFQGLIQANLRLASNPLIRCIENCAYLIEKINKELTQTKAAENDIKGDIVKTISSNSRSAKDLFNYTDEFVTEHDEFCETVWKIKNFWV
jgi:hypothetical protein